MFTTLAVLVYLAAVLIPGSLLYCYGSTHWYWHLLAIAAAIGLGFVPLPPGLQGPGFDLLFGFVFSALLVWGIGGLFPLRPHREKHA